jgi:hypothetical protein
VAELFTGFWETRGPEGDEVLTTLKYVPAEQLLDRLKQRLAGVPPGTHVRIDLMAWEDHDG